MVEMALVLPVIIMLVMGIFEFGMAWRGSLTVSNALRSGTRAAANGSESRLSDYNALVASTSAMAGIPNATITKIVIFKSNGSSGDVPEDCLTASAMAAGGVSTGTLSAGVRCNVYGTDDLETFTLADFGGTTSCSTGAWDQVWCPTSREGSQAAGADYLGVYMEVEQAFQTGLFGSGITITDETIMRLEPEAQ
jgi:hypothetical protein